MNSNYEFRWLTLLDLVAQEALEMRCDVGMRANGTRHFVDFLSRARKEQIINGDGLFASLWDGSRMIAQSVSTFDVLAPQFSQLYTPESIAGLEGLETSAAHYMRNWLVDPDYQQQGLMAQLLVKTTAAMAEYDSHPIYAGTLESNATALATAHNAGFVPCGTVNRKKDGAKIILLHYKPALAKLAVA